MGQMDKLFRAAAKNITKHTSVPCRYARGGTIKSIRAYFNNPAATTIDAIEMGVDADFVEWYVDPESLRRKGFGKPKEFDRIIYRDEEWEVSRIDGNRHYRDAWPDIAIFTRKVKERK